MPEPVWPKPPAAPQPQGRVNLMVGERELTTGLLAKEGAGLRSRAHTADAAGLKPVAVTRRVFLLALPGAASF